LRQDMVDRLVSEGDDDQPALPGPSRSVKTAEQPNPHSSLLSSPPRVRRYRAKSVHIPAPPSEVDRSFYLSHYSTDQQYSLKQGDLELELGLGDDFNMSFGEAMRRGADKEELPLPREALRVLSEAKENSALRMTGKQGRKGSIGMGLFRESRAAALAAMSRAKKKDEVIGEAVTPASPPRTAPASIRGTPSSRIRETMEDEGMESASSTGIQVFSSSLLRRDGSSRRPSGPSLQDEIPSPVEDDSGWTTTSSGDLSISDEEQRMKRDSIEDSGTDEGTDEEERMTVPLQPFDHAVGGHSSLYKFTRRAVCKVSHASCSALAPAETLQASSQPRKPVLRRGRTFGTCSSSFHSAIPRSYARQLSQADEGRLRNSRGR